MSALAIAAAVGSCRCVGRRPMGIVDDLLANLGLYVGPTERDVAELELVR